MVDVGDGIGIHCQGKCTYFILEIQGLKIQQDFFIFNIWRVEIVLELECLAIFGEVKADFGNLKLAIGGGVTQ